MIIGIGSLVLAAGPVAARDEPGTASAVLGQRSFSETTCGILCQPDALVVDPSSGRLYVSDFIHNRVLSWPTAWKFKNGDNPDLVLGPGERAQLV